jgi:hypothetical protein
LVLFGRPTDDEESVFQLDDLEAFAAEIEDEIEVEARII